MCATKSHGRTLRMAQRSTEPEARRSQNAPAPQSRESTATKRSSAPFLFGRHHVRSLSWGSFQIFLAEPRPNGRTQARRRVEDSSTRQRTALQAMGTGRLQRAVPLRIRAPNASRESLGPIDFDRPFDLPVAIHPRGGRSGPIRSMVVPTESQHCTLDSDQSDCTGAQHKPPKTTGPTRPWRSGMCLHTQGTPEQSADATPISSGIGIHSNLALYRLLARPLAGESSQGRFSQPQPDGPVQVHAIAEMPLDPSCPVRA